jgi:hypothetical protein
LGGIGDSSQVGGLEKIKSETDDLVRLAAGLFSENLGENT